MERAFYSTWVSRLSHSEGLIYIQLCVKVIDGDMSAHDAERHMRNCFVSLRSCCSCEHLRSICTRANGWPFDWQAMKFAPKLSCPHQLALEAWQTKQAAAAFANQPVERLAPVQANGLAAGPESDTQQMDADDEDGGDCSVQSQSDDGSDFEFEPLSVDELAEEEQIEESDANAMDVVEFSNEHDLPAVHRPVAQAQKCQPGTQVKVKEGVAMALGKH